LPDSNIVSLYQDRSGLLWVGTKTGGVARWNPRSWSFGHHRFSEAGGDSVTSFAVDSRGLLWVGSFGAGVASIDPLNGAVKRYRRGAEGPFALHDDDVMAVVTDDHNRVWLGTMSAGVERLDLSTGKVTQFNYAADDPTTLPARGVMSLLRDAQGRIWSEPMGAAWRESTRRQIAYFATRTVATRQAGCLGTGRPLWPKTEPVGSGSVRTAAG